MACPQCHYIGNPHLCGCIAAIGEALRNDDLDEAKRRYEALIAAANEANKARVEYRGWVA